MRRRSGVIRAPDPSRSGPTESLASPRHAAATLRVVLPVALMLIFLILYLQFRRISMSLLVFSGVFVAWAGGFLLVWLYGQPCFLALFGIATDDGVIIGTYLKQSFAERRPETVQAVRDAVLEAGRRRVRPCLMTTATTLLALLAMFLVPVLACALEERRLARLTA